MALTVIDECRISLLPAELRPPLPLTFFDITWLDFKPVERLFFYRLPLSSADFLRTHLPSLKSSLVLALGIFYPLAGAIRQTADSADRFEMRYCEGDSVCLTVCELAQADFDVFSGCRQRPIKGLKWLVPILPKSLEAQSLFAVQVTLFPNQGLCLALSIHHAACDGVSSMHFLKTWAAAARAAPPPPPPSFDRSSIPDPLGLYSKLAGAVILRRSAPHPASPPPPQPPPPALTAATFTVSSSLIRNLKDSFRSMAGEREKPPFRMSSFVVSMACAWTCFVKAKQYDIHRIAHLFFSVDWRNRMRPPPPANYFGNCLGCPCFVKAAVGDIVGEKDGIFRACEAIGNAIEGIGDDLHKGIEQAPEKIKEVLQYKPLTVAGSPKLQVYETDFGWGSPEKVEVTSIAENAAVSLAESRDDKGGVEIGVVLPENETEEFGKQFKKLQAEWEDKQQ